MLRHSLFATTLMALLASHAASAQPADHTFAGKNITLVIGYPPGSGNDILGRLVARHLGKHLPGQPKVVAQNMPGAGSFKAANYLYSAAPKDGTYLGLIAQTASTEELIGNSAIQFKSANFNWIGRISSYNIVTLNWHTSKVRSIADAQKTESSMGATGVGSTVYIYPRVMNRVLGTRFKIISGYEGTAQSSLAMERGEVDGVTMGWFTLKSTKKEWLDARKVNVMVQFMLGRHPDLPDVPSIVEFATNADDRQVLELFANEAELGKAILAPPGLPANVLVTLRKAFDAMTADAEFIADADKLQIERDALTGEKLQKLIERVSETPPAIIARARSLSK